MTLDLLTRHLSIHDDGDDSNGPPSLATLPVSDSDEDESVTATIKEDNKCEQESHYKVEKEVSIEKVSKNDESVPTSVDVQSEPHDNTVQSTDVDAAPMSAPVQPYCIYQEHSKMIGRTTDPALLDYDLAVQEFQQGVACARHGNYNRAQELIGSAFLRNEKSIQHIEMLPSALLHDEYDGASIHVIEHSLFLRLLDHPHPEITVFLIMQVCAGAVLGGHPEEGRRRVNIAIKSGEKLIQLHDKGHWSDDDDDCAYTVPNGTTNPGSTIDSAPSTETYSFSIDEKKDDDDHLMQQRQQEEQLVAFNINDVVQQQQQKYGARNLYGTLKRWRIHRQQSALHSVVGNFLMTYTELENALQTVPANQPAMVCQVSYDLASLCMSCQLKPMHECFSLLYQVVTIAVIQNQLYDTMCLPLCYAYLALIAAKNPTILPANLMITHMDAFMLMEESDRCQQRYEELHIQPSSSSSSPYQLDFISVERLKMKMDFLKIIGNPKQIRTWKLFDRQRSIVVSQCYEKYIQQQKQKQQQYYKENTSSDINVDSATTSTDFIMPVLKNTWTSTRATKCLVCHKQQQSGTCTTIDAHDSSCDNHSSQESSSLSLMKCTRCKLAFYCSKECQKKDWTIHKFYCKQLIASGP